MIRKHKYDYDLIVIGSGAGGSVGAHYAQSLGKKVAVVESGEVGGECPNYACVPTKALLHSAHLYESTKNAELFGVNISKVKIDSEQVNKWRNLVVSRTGASHGEELFKQEGLHLIKARAKFVSRNEIEAGGKIYSAQNFLIATGSEVFIPPIQGLEKGGYITFREAGNLKKLPSSIFILGGGPVGCEFAQIFASFGVKVTIADLVDKLLFKEDVEVKELMQALFDNQGINILCGINVEKVEKKGKKKIIHYKKDGENHSLEADEILIATGKKPVLDIDPDKIGVKVEKGKIVTNKYLQTSVANIYAAGDVVGPYLFTHTGENQSYLAAHNAFSRRKVKADMRVVPRCVFTSPEVASVGLTEAEARENGMIKVGITPIAQVGRANTSNEFDGFVKVVCDSQDTIIGASIVAPTAGEMIHELALAVKLRAKAGDIANMMHAYPTFSEAIKFACSSLEAK